MKLNDVPPSRSISRRSLIAAASIAMTVLGTGAALGHGRSHGHGHGRGWGWGWGRDGGGGGGVQCFLYGTSIRTPSGNREISTLAVGDLVLTHSGEAKPIKWIGHRRLERDEGQPWSRAVTPVMIARSALADDVPRANLYLSPSHGIYLNGRLISVGSLINGCTISRADPNTRDVLEYFNLELSDHDLIFAEGLVTETMIPSERSGFDNWLEDHQQQSTARSMPVISPAGRRQQLQSRFRSALAPLVDRRTTFDRVRDHIEERAERLKIAA